MKLPHGRLSSFWVVLLLHHIAEQVTLNHNDNVNHNDDDTAVSIQALPESV